MSTVATATTKPILSSQPQFKNILFATDFSFCSELALVYAREIALRFGSTIHIVHVVGPDPLIGPLAVHYPQVEEEDAAAWRALAKLIQGSALSCISYTETIERGSVWDVVSKLIADRSIDLIVLGTHGRGGLKHLVLGSVAEQIFRHANCPVLTVGPKARDGLREGKIATIVYATDFSPGSQAALPYALCLARVDRAAMILVHAVRPTVGGDTLPVLPDGMVENAKLKLERLVPDDIRQEAIAKVGLAAELILTIAAERKADLIVMGAHRGTSHTVWAVAHQVVSNAACSVLTVRS